MREMNRANQKTKNRSLVVYLLIPFMPLYALVPGNGRRKLSAITSNVMAKVMRAVAQVVPVARGV